MGSRSRPGQVADRPAADRRPDWSQVVEFAAARLLRDDSPAALPAVLRRLAGSFGARAALALQCPAPGQLGVLAAYPRQAAADPALLTGISALCGQHQELTASGGSLQALLAAPRAEGRLPGSALLAAAGPAPGQPPLVLVLTGDTGKWRGRAEAAARAVASIIAARLQHAGTAAALAERESASEARFRQLAELAPVGIVQTDSAGRVVFANDRWCALTGLSARDAVGGSWTRAVHPADIGRVEQERARAFEHGAELCTDCRLRPSGGEEVWVHAAVAPLAGPGGQPAGGLAALTDVSGRKREEHERARLLAAEQQARRSLADQTQRLQSLIAAAIPGVLFTDEDGMITQLNQSFCDLFGIAAEPGELAGTPVTSLVREIKKVFSDPAEFVRRTGEAAARREPASGEQMTCTDGRTIECDYWPVLAGERYRGDLWLAWDMSDRRELERQRERAIEAELAARELAELARQQLEEQNRRLEQAASEKTQYLAAASHELGTPLTSIVAFTELVRHEAGSISTDIDEALEVIERNAEQLRHMVGELSLLSRIEAGILPLDLAPVSISALIEQAARSASASAAQRGSTIEVSAPDGPPVQGNRHRLRQVLDNLIANAVKFSDPGGRIRVSARRDGRWWQIEVENSGIGIPAGELSTIFDRFSRASNARIAGVAGTGLGLSIVKAITELHGGRVEARSTPGKQTVLRVCLPVRPPSGAAG